MHPVRLSLLIVLCAAMAACKPGPKPVVQPSADAAPQAPGLPNGTLTGPAGAPPPAATAHADTSSATVSGDPDALRCDRQVGKAAAKRLVTRCLMVSPASHPPCNAANACEMIRDEIKRSCDLFGADKPKECTG
jgi:hypothetical protein